MAANWFVALPVPAGGWLETLQPPPGVRLFAPEDLHLTLAFLGAVSAERARAAFACAETLPLQPLEIGLGQVVPLGSRRRPSAFSALLEQGRAEVERAIAAIRDALCDAAGAPRDARPPLAHITLARPVRAATPQQLQAARAWASSLSLTRARAWLSRVALFTWSRERTADRAPAAPEGVALARRSEVEARPPLTGRPPRFRIDRELPLAR